MGTQQRCSIGSIQLQLTAYDWGEKNIDVILPYWFYYRYLESKGKAFNMAKDLIAMFTFQKPINAGMCKGYGLNA